MKESDIKKINPQINMITNYDEWYQEKTQLAALEKDNECEGWWLMKENQEKTKGWEGARFSKNRL